MSKKKKTSDVIKKKENHSFTKKFSEKEKQELEKAFSILCVEKSKNESRIEKLKEAIKSDGHKIKTIASKLEEGGENAWEECDVEIIVSEMKKNYYYEGQLVDTEDADDSDLQLEIED